MSTTETRLHGLAQPGSSQSDEAGQPFRSTAQNHEDVLLWRALARSRHRRYVDAAGPDPLGQSIAQAFSAVGWRGLVVSADAAHCRRLTLVQPDDTAVLAAAGAADGTATIYAAEGIVTRDPGLAECYQRAGVAVRSAQIPLRPLAALIGGWGAGVIDFLVIAADGEAAAALAGADLAASRPRIVVVRGRPDAAAMACLERAAYREAAFAGVHRFFVADEEWAALSPCFALPPHPGDAGLAELDPTPDLASQALAISREAAHRTILAEREVFRSRIGQERAQREAAASLAAKHAELVRLDAVAQATLAELREASHQLREMHGSTSWRITWPLRLAGRIVRALRTGQGVVGPAASAAAPAAPAIMEPAACGELEQALSRRLAGALPNVEAQP